MLTEVTRQTTIGDITQQHPELIEPLLKLGVHCVGCHVSYWETLEQGFRGHGMTEAKIDEAVQFLNQKMIKHEDHAGEPIVLTEKAASKVKEILEKEQHPEWGLRIEIAPGGCSGHSYQMTLDDKPQEQDEVLELNGVKMFLSSGSKELLAGATIDYVDALQGAGFRITPPAGKHVCGCGQSFG